MEGRHSSELKLDLETADLKSTHLATWTSQADPSEVSSESVTGTIFYYEGLQTSASGIGRMKEDVGDSKNNIPSESTAGLNASPDGKVCYGGDASKSAVCGTKEDGVFFRGMDEKPRETEIKLPTDHSDDDHGKTCGKDSDVLASSSCLGQLKGVHQESNCANGVEKTPENCQRADSAPSRKRKQARRRATKHCPSLPHPPCVSTRGNPQVRSCCLSDLSEDICPMRRWPCAVRPERPVYPDCMEGVEDVVYVASSGSSSEDSSDENSCGSAPSTDGAAAVSWDSAEGLERCIVPGALESIVVFCRTSPLLPLPLRPDPEALRGLLHDTCVLQCILRGVGPTSMAAYLDSEASKMSACDFRELSDAAIFAGE